MSNLLQQHVYVTVVPTIIIIIIINECVNTPVHIQQVNALCIDPFNITHFLLNTDTSLQLDDHMNCSISLTTNEMEIFVYKVVAGIFVGVTMAILLLILIMSLAALCQRKCK